MAENLKPRSGVITDGPDRAPSRAMLKAVGFTDEDLRRPIVGVANIGSRSGRAIIICAGWLRR